MNTIAGFKPIYLCIRQLIIIDIDLDLLVFVKLAERQSSKTAQQLWRIAKEQKGKTTLIK